MVLLVGGGNFALYLPITAQVFGKEYSGANYGLIYVVYSTSIMLNTILLADIRLDFNYTCVVLASITLFGFLNLCSFAYFLFSTSLEDYLLEYIPITLSGDVESEKSNLKKPATWYDDYVYDVGL